jgi:hypothetical protein
MAWQHISDDDLERYYLGMATDESDLAPLEEHLLACSSCAERTEEAIRAAIIEDGYDLTCSSSGSGTRNPAGDSFVLPERHPQRSEPVMSTRDRTCREETHSTGGSCRRIQHDCLPEVRIA